MTARQYLRKISIVVGGGPSPVVTETPSGTTTTFTEPGEAIDFAAFRVTFHIRRGDVQTPNSADIRIYNVSDATANRVTKEFTRIVLQGGYDGNFGILFDGTIKQARRGRLDAKDTYIDIAAADGDQFYNFAPISLSLADGAAKPSDMIQLFLKYMPGSIVRGYIPELSTNAPVRGRVYYGMLRDELSEFAAQNDCLWSIQDGQLTLIPLTSYIPGEPVLLSPATGVIGQPEQTQNGISVRTLLNPSVKIGQLVKLDSTINPFRYGLDVRSQAQLSNLALSIKTNADRLYYVMNVDHHGDTRGNEFYSDLTCLAVDATVPKDLAPRAAIAPEAASIARD